jgi:hypothetical protein
MDKWNLVILAVLVVIMGTQLNSMNQRLDQIEMFQQMSECMRGLQ